MSGLHPTDSFDPLDVDNLADGSAIEYVLLNFYWCLVSIAWSGIWIYF